jgi:Asp-tRNA(Asn)/Glu-tRNA(Gln) amidotransferase C subunit
MDTYFYRFIFMRFLFLLSILMFLVLLTAASLSSLQQPLCHDDERSALLQFKDSFILDKSASGDPFGYPKDVASWSLEGGTSTDCCSWDGVDCNEDTGHVIGLDLASSWLYGSFNSSNSLFRLLQLQSLNLADNRFNHSQIPIEVGNLSRLTYLNLSYSVFAGQIPSELSHLNKLSSLDLSRNSNLNSTLSDLSNLVQNFTTLEELLLQDNNFSSPIPESLANLSSLTTLNLENCELRGEFPTRIFQLPNLRDLRIGWNLNLTGHLPEFRLGNPLKVLSIGDTSFFASVRSIPPSLSNLTQLTHLDLSRNTLTGHIPSSVFANLTQLTHLDLSRNTLTGHIPPSVFANLTQLAHLDLSGNTLTGDIPPSVFANLTQLAHLDLSENTLTGDIPPSVFANLTQLAHLDLSGNTLT